MIMSIALAARRRVMPRPQTAVSDPVTLPAIRDRPSSGQRVFVTVKLEISGT